MKHLHIFIIQKNIKIVDKDIDTKKIINH